MTVIVLGMHKSGTSLVAEMLHRSGVSMVRSFDENQSYEQGRKFERLEVVHLNQEILGFGDPAVVHARPPIIEATETQRTRLREILRDCAESGPDWGIKDPRLCWTYPIWESEIGDHRLVVVYRSLGKVWWHYNRPPGRRNWTHHVLRAWCEYNEGILEVLERTTRDFVVVSYEKLMTSDRELKRLEAFVGRQLPDVRRPGRSSSSSRTPIRLLLQSRLRGAVGLLHPKTQR